MEAAENFIAKHGMKVLLLILAAYTVWYFFFRKKTVESSFKGDVYGGGAPRDIL